MLLKLLKITNIYYICIVEMLCNGLLLQISSLLWHLVESC